MYKSFTFHLIILVILLGVCNCNFQNTTVNTTQNTSSESSKTQETKKDTSYNKRQINNAEKPFVGAWRTVFKDVKGKLYERGNYIGNFLLFNEDGSYQQYRDSTVIRTGVWKYEESKKELEMKTKKNEFLFTVSTLLPNMLEMRDRKHGYNLVYVPYQP